MVHTEKFRQIKYTAADDNAHTLTELPLIFTSVDIQILTNDAYFGDAYTQEFELSAGDIVSYRNEAGLDIRKFYFKNQGAGNNIKVVVNGILKG